MAPRVVASLVCIDIPSNADRAVPEQIGHRLDVHARLKPSHGGTVPQGVHTDALDAALGRRESRCRLLPGRACWQPQN